MLRHTCLILSLLATGFAQQAPSLFGVNLIINGGAEQGEGAGSDVIVDAIPGWTSNGSTVLTYASGYGLSTTDLVPAGAGLNYFSNGDTSSNMTQMIDLTAGADVIDSGAATFDASGYFGGYSDYDDNATLVIAFLDANGATLKTITLGGIQSADRRGTGLYLRRQVGAVPVGARSAQLSLNFVMLTSSRNNAYADNLSLTLNSPASLADVFQQGNLIVDGDAESSVQSIYNDDFSNDIPGWVRTPNFTADAYGASGADLDSSSAAPPDAGKLYFYGGPSNPASTGYQDIDISQGATKIDTGNVTFNLSAWLGGYSSQGDYTVLTVQFLDWSGTLLSTATLGPVGAGDRNNSSGLVQQVTTGTVPAGARMVHVQLDMTRTDGSDDDGLADSLSLSLTAPPDVVNATRARGTFN